MPESIRFHLDEHLDPAIARALRRYGVDVTTTPESGLRTKNDEAQFDFARTEGRTIVTRDPDFLRLAARSGTHPGIVYCTKAHPIGEIVRGLLLIHGVLSPDELKDRIEYL